MNKLLILLILLSGCADNPPKKVTTLDDIFSIVKLKCKDGPYLNAMDRDLCEMGHILKECLIHQEIKECKDLTNKFFKEK